MKLKDFIKENKDEIDKAIKRVCNNCKLNNKERKMWILNDESLYRWAKSNGVRI